MTTGAAGVQVKFKQGNRVVSGTPTARAGVVGCFLRGPFDRRTCTSERMFLELYGGPFDSEHCHVAQNVKQFFDSGGTSLDVVRVVHFTDPSDVATRTSDQGEATIQNDGSSEAPATVTSVATAPFKLDLGMMSLIMSIDGGGAQTHSINGTAAYQTSAATFPTADQDGEDLTLVVDQGDEQTITFNATATTALEFAEQINNQIKGGKAKVTGGQVVVESDKKGTGSYVEITGGTSNAVLAFPTAEVQGTGDFADMSAVSAADLKTWVEANYTGVSVTANGPGTVTFSTTSTGASASIQMTSSEIQAALQLDTNLHNGTDATPEDTLTFIGKTDGDYTDDVTFQIADASNGEAARFDVIVLYKGSVDARYRNYTMDPDDDRYIVTLFNDDAAGSNLLDVTDLDLINGSGLSVLQARPANGSYGPLTGGDSGLTGLVDADFIGSSATKTGLYSFDRDEDIKLISIPGRSTTSIHAALHAYEVSREHMVYMVHPTPKAVDVATAQAMRTFSQANLYGQSEFGCCGWPRIQIPNLWTDVFGNDEGIYVCPSMSKMGRFAYNDRLHPDGVFVSTAGVENGNIPNCIGVEVEEVQDKAARDLIADVGIEPIWKETGWPYCFDGGDNLTNNGNWPRQWHARGTIYIVESLRRDAVSMKHKKNNDKNRGEWQRRGQRFLDTLPEDAFDPDAETFWQVDEETNPPAIRNQQEMVGLLGLGYSQDAKYVTIEVTRTLAG